MLTSPATGRNESSRKQGFAMTTFARAAFLAILFAPLPAAAGCPDGPGPAVVLSQYLEQLSTQRFEEAYSQLSKGMKADSPKEEWVGAYRDLFAELNVEVLGIEVGAPRFADEESSGCATEASVPNVLRARDMFNAAGSVEYERYSMVLENGAWKVDRQHLVEEKDIPEWFPETVAD